MRYAIYPERQGTVTGSSEDANCPWSFLTGNDVRKKVGKAADGVQTVTLRCAIAANAEAIQIHKTNAETAICTITLDSNEQNLDNAAAVDEAGTLVGIPLTGHGYSSGQTILLNGTDDYDGVYLLGSQAAGGVDEIIIDTGVAFVAETFDGDETACIIVESTTHTLETATRTYDRFHQEYTEQTAAHKATIKLTAATGETAEAGILRAGLLETIGNPLKEPVEKSRNYSEKEQLHNGSFYTVKLDIVRTFSYSMLLTRSTTFRDLMDLYDYYSDDPFAMLITDNEGDDNMYAIFGFIEGEPGGTHLATKTRVPMFIVEAV